MHTAPDPFTIKKKHNNKPFHQMSTSQYNHKKKMFEKKQKRTYRGTVTGTGAKGANAFGIAANPFVPAVGPAIVVNQEELDSFIRVALLISRKVIEGKVRRVIHGFQQETTTSLHIIRSHGRIHGRFSHGVSPRRICPWKSRWQNVFGQKNIHHRGLQPLIDGITTIQPLAPVPRPWGFE
jgi:hypothetical protein